MKKCNICGRTGNRVSKVFGKWLCPKHRKQYKKYGKPIDTTPRTVHDLNNYIIRGGETVIFILYNQKNEPIDTFLVDVEELEKVKYKKWRLSKGQVVCGVKDKKQTLSKTVFGKEVLSFINGNKRDFRKENLILGN